MEERDAKKKRRGAEEERGAPPLFGFSFFEVCLVSMFFTFSVFIFWHHSVFFGILISRASGFFRKLFSRTGTRAVRENNDPKKSRLVNFEEN